MIKNGHEGLFFTNSAADIHVLSLASTESVVQSIEDPQSTANISIFVGMTFS